MTTAAAAPDTSADSTATVASNTDTTTAASAATDKGQAGSQDGTSQAVKTPQATTTAQEESFFDPNAIPDELKPAYKQMQAAFTKKMQGISKDRQAVDAYRAFERDPIGNMQAMAQKFGYQLTRAEAAQAVKAQGGMADFNPNNWEEVFTKMEERAEARIMAKVQNQFAPLVENVQKVTASNIERQLDDLDPNWRMYEDDMKATIQEHPSLVRDVAKLYRLSVPEEVLASRATQAALRKLENKGQAASVHGASTSKTVPAPKRATSFAEAVELARASEAAKRK